MSVVHLVACRWSWCAHVFSPSSFPSRFRALSCRVTLLTPLFPLSFIISLFRSHFLRLPLRSFTSLCGFPGEGSGSWSLMFSFGIYLAPEHTLSSPHFRVRVGSQLTTNPWVIVCCHSPFAERRCSFWYIMTKVLILRLPHCDCSRKMSRSQSRATPLPGTSV